MVSWWRVLDSRPCVGSEPGAWAGSCGSGACRVGLRSAMVLGGLGGGVLLLNTDEKVFARAVPWLILAAVALLAAQDRVRGFILARAGRSGGRGLPETWVLAPLIPAAVYGGFFGAGVSVLIIAVLGLVLSDTLTRLNGLKQALSLANNLAAATFFLFSGRVVWSAALVMVLGGLFRAVGRSPACVRAWAWSSSILGRAWVAWFILSRM